MEPCRTACKRYIIAAFCMSIKFLLNIHFNLKNMYHHRANVNLRQQTAFEYQLLRAVMEQNWISDNMFISLKRCLEILLFLSLIHLLTLCVFRSCQSSFQAKLFAQVVFQALKYVYVKNSREWLIWALNLPRTQTSEEKLFFFKCSTPPWQEAIYLRIYWKLLALTFKSVHDNACQKLHHWQSQNSVVCIRFRAKYCCFFIASIRYIRCFVCSVNETTSSSCSPLTAIHVTRISFEFINSIMHLCKIPLRGSTALSVFSLQVTAFGFTAKRSTELFRSSVKENVMCVCHKYIYAAATSYTVQTILNGSNVAYGINLNCIYQIYS